MESPDVPQAPDPVATAAAQGQANLEAARTTAALNRPNQITPFGSLTWSQAPSTRQFDQAGYDAAMQKWQQAGGAGGQATLHGDWATLNPGAGYAAPNREDFYRDVPSDQWTSTVTLDPRIQALIDSQLQVSQGLSGSIGRALERVDQMGAAPVANDEMRQRVEDALYDRYRSRLDPLYAEAEEALRARLVNAGVPVGSQAWESEMRQHQFGRNDAYENAMRAAITTGGAEQSRLFDMEGAVRTRLLNELASLRSGQQVQMPTFSSGMSGTQVQPAPVAQAVYNSYQGDMNAYNAGVAGNNSLLGGLFSLGSAAIGAPTGTFSWLR